MVKYGCCFITCNKCQKGIGILTNIDRNSERWEEVHSDECDHFNLAIDSLTRSTYLCINDEINFNLHANCKNCHNERVLNPKCKSIETDSGIEVKECCGMKLIFQYEFTSYFQSENKTESNDEIQNDEHFSIQKLDNLAKITYKNSYLRD